MKRLLIVRDFSFKKNKIKIGIGISFLLLLVVSIVTPIVLLNSNSSSKDDLLDTKKFEATVNSMFNKKRKIIKNIDRKIAETYTANQLKELTEINYELNEWAGSFGGTLSDATFSNKALMDAMYTSNLKLMKNQNQGGIFDTKIIVNTHGDSGNNLKKHPAADFQYGKIKDNIKAVSKQIVIDKKIIGQEMVGLFAPAGEYITINFPNKTDEEVEAMGLEIQFAWNEDREISKDELMSSKSRNRIPIPSKSFKISHNGFMVGSPIGGTLAINITKNLLENVSLIIDGGIEQLEYIHGYTTEEDWKNQLSKGVQAPMFSMSNDYMNAITNIGDFLPYLEEFPYKNMVLVTKIFQIGQWIKNNDMNRYNAFDLKGTSFIKYGAAYCNVGNSAVGPFSWIRALFNYDGNINSPSWGIYHEINHEYQRAGGYLFGLPDPIEVTNNAMNLINFQLLNLVNVERINSDGDYATKSWRQFNDPFGSMLNYEDRVVNKSNQNVNLEFYSTLMHAFGVKKQLQWFRSYGVVPPKPVPVGSPNEVKWAREIMETIVRIAYFTGFDVRNFLNEAYGENISINGKTKLSIEIRKSVEYHNYLNDGLRTGKFKKFNTIASLYSSKSTNIFGQTIATGKPFKINPSKPFTFKLSDPSKTKVFTGKSLKWLPNGNLGSQENIKNSISSIDDIDISFVGKPYDLKNIELIDKGNSEYEYNSSSSDFKKMASFKYDIYLRDQSYITSQGELPIFDSKPFLEGSKNKGWNKFTQTVEFSFSSLFANEKTYNTPKDIFFGAINAQEKLKRSIDLILNKDTEYTNQDFDNVENKWFNGIRVKSVSLELVAPKSGYYEFDLKCDDNGFLWTNKADINIEKDKPILITEDYSKWFTSKSGMKLKKGEKLNLFLIIINNGVGTGGYSMKYKSSENNIDWTSSSFNALNTNPLHKYRNIINLEPPINEIPTLSSFQNYDKKMNLKKPKWTISNPSNNSVYNPIEKFENLIDGLDNTSWQPKATNNKKTANIKIDFNESIEFKQLNFLFVDRSDRWPTYIKAKYFDSGKWFDFATGKEVSNDENDFSTLKKSNVNDKNFMIPSIYGNGKSIVASKVIFEFNLDKNGFVNIREFNLLGLFSKHNIIYPPKSENIIYNGKWEQERYLDAEVNTSLITSSTSGSSITFSLENTSFFQIYSIKDKIYGDFDIFVNGKLYNNISLFNEQLLKSSMIESIILNPNITNKIKIINKNNKKVNFDYFAGFNENFVEKK